MKKTPENAVVLPPVESSPNSFCTFASTSRPTNDVTMSNPPLRASTLYKKQDGTLSLSKDRQTVLWTSIEPPGSPPSLKIKVSDISSECNSSRKTPDDLLPLLTHIVSPDLQKSPAASARVSVRIVVQPPGGPGPENHDFRFTSPTAAKAEQ